MTNDPRPPVDPMRGRGADEAWLAIAKVIGQRIRQLRQDHGHSQSEMAAVIRVTFQQGQKYERGLNRLPVDKLYRLSRHYGVPTDYFFDEVPPAAEGTAGASPRGRLLLQISRQAEGLTPAFLRAVLAIIRAAIAEEGANAP
jgi:transcriptional regulator with XRE-family HTH domain